MMQPPDSAMPSDATRATGPLAGVRILDLTAVVLGPLATQILADYGAEVIKVEGLEGDLMRANGVSKVKGMSSIFLALNRNKRYIRGLVAPKLEMKFTPEIRYRVDTALDYANHIDELLKSPEVARDLDKK